MKASLRTTLAALGGLSLLGCASDAKQAPTIVQAVVAPQASPEVLARISTPDISKIGGVDISEQDLDAIDAANINSKDKVLMALIAQKHIETLIENGIITRDQVEPLKRALKLQESSSASLNVLQRWVREIFENPKKLEEEIKQLLPAKPPRRREDLRNPHPQRERWSTSALV